MKLLFAQVFVTIALGMLLALGIIYGLDNTLDTLEQENLSYSLQGYKSTCVGVEDKPIICNDWEISLRKNGAIK